MKDLKVITIIGTRPEIIKMSPLIPLFDNEFNHILIHTGQHYSANMDKIFFEELDLRQPDYTFDCGGMSSVEQVAKIMIRLDEILQKQKINAIIVHGDTNTTLAGALTGAKYKAEGLKVIHIEAGCRSHNLLQAEEINRLVVDRVSDFMFVPTIDDAKNLINEGYSEDRFEVTGNTVVDSCVRTAESTDPGPILLEYGLKSRDYALLTMHRQETVDSFDNLRSMINTIDKISETIKIVFPIHPRTLKMMNEFDIKFESKNLEVIEPIGYLKMINLLKESAFCLTDSGGLQEEAATLRVPTIVLRNETEYLHYVREGILYLSGISSENIIEISTKLVNIKNNSRVINVNGNGSTLKILNKLKSLIL